MQQCVWRVIPSSAFPIYYTLFSFYTFLLYIHSGPALLCFGYFILLFSLLLIPIANGDSFSLDSVLYICTGKPTTVFFHVTVMSLDSIDESSMVSNFNFLAHFNYILYVICISICINLPFCLSYSFSFFHSPYSFLTSAVARPFPAFHFLL